MTETSETPTASRWQAEAEGEEWHDEHSPAEAEERAEDACGGPAAEHEQTDRHR
jgi:hypothetical protein